MNYLLLAAAILIAIVGQLLLKTGVEHQELAASPRIILEILQSKYLLSGFILYGLGALLWLSVLKKFPLSVAYPALSISYIVILIASAIFFHETVTIRKMVATVTILIGVIVLFT